MSSVASIVHSNDLYSAATSSAATAVATKPQTVKNIPSFKPQKIEGFVYQCKSFTSDIEDNEVFPCVYFPTLSLSIAEHFARRIRVQENSIKAEEAFKRHRDEVADKNPNIAKRNYITDEVESLIKKVQLASQVKIFIDDFEVLAINKLVPLLNPKQFMSIGTHLKLPELCKKVMRLVTNNLIEQQLKAQVAEYSH